jgi:tRNA wybutosine-synthesizing protein 2
MLKPVKKLLIDNLDIPKSKIPLIPSSYQKIGDIIIFNLKEGLENYGKDIGKTFLKKIPNTRTVCVRTGFIKNQFRQPQVKVIAGNKNTETIHKEHGVSFKIDVSNIMFSKGNLNERKRITKLVNDGEVIVDMFAGIGYFSIGIAKFSEASKVYSIELNPISYQYLCENIKLNDVQDKIIPILGDCVVEIPKLGRIGDRILMGLLPSSKDYLLDAMKAIKPNGIIHYHGTGKKEDWKKMFEDVETAAEIASFKTELIRKVKVKSYAPKIYHWVLDCRIKDD